MNKLELEIIDKVPSINQIYAGMHWGKRKALADEKHWLIKAQILSKVKSFKPPLFKKAFVSYEIYFKSNIRRDWDNLFLKLYNDGLVQAGVIPDDDSEHLILKDLTIKKGQPIDKLVIILHNALK